MINHTDVTVAAIEALLTCRCGTEFCLAARAYADAWQTLNPGSTLQQAGADGHALGVGILLYRKAQGIPLDRPRIVTLCGSTRFAEAFAEANYRLTLAGKIVLSVGFYMHAVGNRHGESVGATPEQKLALDDLHKRKIEISDEIFVLNVGGYIGESTRREIDHAKQLGKPVYYLEDPDEWTNGAAYRRSAGYAYGRTITVVDE